MVTVPVHKNHIGFIPSPTPVRLNIIDQSSPDVYSEPDLVAVINNNLRTMERNNRHNVALALGNGKRLEMLKPIIKARGESWIEYVLNKTQYHNIRVAQLHMKLWERWQPYIGELVSIGAIDTNHEDFAEYAFAQHMDDKQISIAVSVLSRFTGDHIPELSQEIMLVMGDMNEQITEAVAKDIIEVSKKIEHLPEKTREIVKEQVKRYGIGNPDIIEPLAEVAEKHPKMAQTLTDSGVVSVPIGECDIKEVPLRHASRTDIQLALGEETYETAMRRKQRIDEWSQSKGFKKVGNPLIGEKSYIIGEMNKILEIDKEYRVMVYEIQEQLNLQ